MELGHRDYHIEIGVGNFIESIHTCVLGLQTEHVFALVDENIASLHSNILAQLERAFDGEITFSRMNVASGESSKSLALLSDVWNQMLEHQVDRKSIVLALGGGVVGDLAGFAAATFARGIRLIQSPTTLLAQVDSSVGGKTGINLPKAKNIVGAFWQPSHVCVDLNFLTTLPRREYVSGLAEVVKYGVIMAPDLFGFLENSTQDILNRVPHVLASTIERCCELKAQVVADDEKEISGRRAILNYGHTFGHAIESIGGYGMLLHGEAIAIGMTMAGRLACEQENFSEEAFSRQTKLLEAFGLPTRLPKNFPSDLTDFFAAMQRDKKNKAGKIVFVLPTHIGHVNLVDDASPSEIERAIEFCRANA